MKQSGKCPKCGSQDVIPDALANDQSRRGVVEMTVSTYASPDALIFKESRESTVSAWVCGACGFIELYADTPKILTL
jgi:predicted nucleic-acid-binding Zn-ribbon protein